MYLHCSSNKSTTTIILFYALCLLYALSSAIVVSDLVGTIILQVSNNPICKNINPSISCAVAYQYSIASISNRLTANNFSPLSCPNHSIRLLRLHRPMYPSMHKPLYLSSVLFNKIFKDLPLLDRVGSKYPCRDHAFIHGSRILRSVDQPIFIS